MVKLVGGGEEGKVTAGYLQSTEHRTVRFALWVYQPPGTAVTAHLKPSTFKQHTLRSSYGSGDKKSKTGLPEVPAVHHFFLEAPRTTSFLAFSTVYRTSTFFAEGPLSQLKASTSQFLADHSSDLTTVKGPRNTLGPPDKTRTIGLF